MLSKEDERALDLWRRENPVCAADKMTMWSPEDIWARMDLNTRIKYRSLANAALGQKCDCAGAALGQKCDCAGEAQPERKADPANPKDGIGAKKVGINFLSGKVISDLAKVFDGLHLVPPQPLFEMALAFVEGSYKYGAHNYRASGVRASIYYAAFNRHMTQWFTKQSDIDADSGIHHTAKAMACVAILMDSRDMGNWVDDRPLRLPVEPWRDDFKKCGNFSASRFYGMVRQEMTIWWEGGSEECLLKALRLLLMLRNEILTGGLQDDRIEQPFDIEAMNVQAKAIALKYPDPVAPYTELEWRDKL